MAKKNCLHIFSIQRPEDRKEKNVVILQKEKQEFGFIKNNRSLVEKARRPAPINNVKLSYYNVYYRSDSDESILIFNCLSEALIKLTPEEYNKILEFSFDVEQKKKLVALGILTDADNDECYLVNLKKYTCFVTDDTKKVFTILPTQHCNARCFYCFEEGITRTRMTQETIDETVRFISSIVNDGDMITFDWFGGEPMCGESIIDAIISGVKKALPFELKYSSLMISNGTLFTHEKIDKYKHDWHLARVQLTVDGTEEEHNRRKNLINSEVNAYQKLKDTIRILLESDIEVFLRFNIDTKNFCMLDAILEDMKEFVGNDNFSIFPAMLKEHCIGALMDCVDESDYAIVYKQAYHKLAINGYIRYLDELLPNVKTKPCQAANINNIVIDSDGYLYKCAQQFANKKVSIGSITKGLIYNENLKFWLQPNYKLADCENCKVFPMCFGGCKYNTQETVNISVCIKYKFLLESFVQLANELYTQGIITIR